MTQKIFLLFFPENTVIQIDNFSDFLEFFQKTVLEVDKNKNLGLVSFVFFEFVTFFIKR